MKMSAGLFSILLSSAKFIINLLLILPSVFSVHVQRKHTRTQVTVFDTSPRVDYVIIAIYPTSGLSLSTKNLIQGFHQNNVGIIAVSNCAPASQDRSFLKDHALVLIERSNLGRDFGAYQAGIRYFRSHYSDSSFNKLFLVNDSLFFSGLIAGLIKQMISNDAGHQGLFENYEQRYHVGSFFLCFQRDVAISPEFNRFWQNYRPYSTRYHCINSGEIKLTQTLMKCESTPRIVYSTSSLFALIHGESDQNIDTKARQLDTWIPESWKQGTSSAASTTMSYQDRLSNFISRCERSNQAHALAICANHVMGAPLFKKDICYRGYWSIASAVQLPQGFNAEDREQMLDELRRKGIPSCFTALQHVRLLFDI